MLFIFSYELGNKIKWFNLGAGNFCWDEILLSFLEAAEAVSENCL